MVIFMVCFWVFVIAIIGFAIYAGIVVGNGYAAAMIISMEHAAKYEADKKPNAISDSQGLKPE